MALIEAEVAGAGESGSSRTHSPRLERVFSLATGAGMAAYGLARRSLPDWALGAVRATSLRGGKVLARKTLTVQRARSEVFTFWRNFENHALFMPHVKRVEQLPDGCSHWTARVEGRTLRWTSSVTQEHDGRSLSWEALPGKGLRHGGHITLRDASGGGTVIDAQLWYRPPLGRIGATLARLFGAEPQQELAEGLRRARQLLETGEIARVDLHTAGPRVAPGKQVIERLQEAGR